MFKRQFVSLVLVFICVLNVEGQHNNLSDLERRFEEIKSLDDAITFLNNDSTVVGDILSINPKIDTLYFDKTVTSKEVGEIFNIKSKDNKFTFLIKIIGWEHINEYRVSYIFMDSDMLGKRQIDSLRTFIFNKLSIGEDFYDLAKRYSMNPNSEKGGI